MENKNVPMSELALALSKAQGEIKAAVKSSENPAFKRDGKVSKYASIEEVIEVIQKPASENGLSVIFNYKTTEDDTFIQYKIKHSSGETDVGDWVSMFISERTLHKFGAANTYMRRQLLKGIYQIPEEDDDGNSASLPSGTHAQSGGGYAGPVVNHAPGADNSAALFSYRVTFGKYKGKTFDEIGPIDIENYCQYIQNKAKEDNKPIKGNVAEFLTLADEYLKGCGTSFANEDVPNF